MPRFMLTHHHLPNECRVAFAAWRGFDSSLRHTAALSTCAGFPAASNREAGAEPHAIWWAVDASDANEAVALLPSYVAERTEVDEVREVAIP
jgi:hypothetical protein